MDLKIIAEEIREVIANRQKDLQLSFVEEEHIYYMANVDGEIISHYPSVSKLIKKFYEPFDAELKAFNKAKGDREEQQRILLEWQSAGDYSTNMGSRVHYNLETETILRNGNYKEVRQPIFECDETQILKGDMMIHAGKKFLDLMEERGAVLLDTEMVLGDRDLKYFGQPDKLWLMLNRDKTDFGYVISDWKTNQPKNFVPQWYTKNLFPPFQKYRDTALEHYYVQLPLYARLFLKMLEGTIYGEKKLLGCVVVLLKEDGSYVEYKVPNEINKTVFNLDMSKYITV